MLRVLGCGLAVVSAVEVDVPATHTIVLAQNPFESLGKLIFGDGEEQDKKAVPPSPLVVTSTDLAHDAIFGQLDVKTQVSLCEATQRSRTKLETCMDTLDQSLSGNRNKQHVMPGKLMSTCDHVVRFLNKAEDSPCEKMIAQQQSSKKSTTSEQEKMMKDSLYLTCLSTLKEKLRNTHSMDDVIAVEGKLVEDCMDTFSDVEKFPEKEKVRICSKLDNKIVGILENHLMKKVQDEETHGQFCKRFSKEMRSDLASSKVGSADVMEVAKKAKGNTAAKTPEKATIATVSPPVKREFSESAKDSVIVKNNSTQENPTVTAVAAPKKKLLLLFILSPRGPLCRKIKQCRIAAQKKNDEVKEKTDINKDSAKTDLKESSSPAKDVDSVSLHSNTAVKSTASVGIQERITGFLVSTSTFSEICKSFTGSLESKAADGISAADRSGAYGDVLAFNTRDHLRIKECGLKFQGIAEHVNNAVEEEELVTHAEIPQDLCRDMAHAFVSLGSSKPDQFCGTYQRAFRNVVPDGNASNYTSVATPTKVFIQGRVNSRTAKPVALISEEIRSGVRNSNNLKSTKHTGSNVKTSVVSVKKVAATPKEEKRVEAPAHSTKSFLSAPHKPRVHKSIEDSFVDDILSDVAE